MSDNNPSQADLSTKIKEIKSKLESELKDLRVVLTQEVDKLKERSKTSLDQGRKESDTQITGLRKEFQQLIKDFDNFTNDQFVDLKESLDGQLNSLRGFANQLVEDEELRLVNSLEASLSNVTDITNSQVNELKALVTSVSDVAEKSAVESIKLVKNREVSIHEELGSALKINGEELSSGIVNLQEQFRDEMNIKIEGVFMGIKTTKEGINEIIRDTLSRLEENLNRLTDGIDQNFSKEVGDAQDLIHTYEGKLLEVIAATQQKYDQEMDTILNTHTDKNKAALDVLQSELLKFKEQIISELQNLNAEQESLFANATKQLEEQIQQSRKAVIDSHGVLKDDLDQLLKTNSENVAEIMQKVRSKSNEIISNINTSVDESTGSQKDSIKSMVDTIRNDIDTESTTLKDHIKQRIQRSENEVKSMDR